MAGTNIGLRDWLLGWIIANPKAGGTGTVGIQAVITVDETGVPTSSGGGQNATIVGPLGQKTMAASVPVVVASDQSNLPANITQVGGSSAAIANGLLPTGPDGSPVSGTATSAATLFTADMIGYESISVQVTSAGSSCTITYETSDDNTNWVSCSGLNAAQLGTSAPGTTSTSAQLITFPKKGRYFRARVSTYGSGTVTVVGNLHKNPQPLTNRITVDGPNATNSTASTFFPASMRAATVNPTANSSGGQTAWIGTTIGAGIVKPYSIPEADVRTGATPVTVTTSDQALIAAAGAGIKNYATGLLITTGATWTANTIQIRNGTTVLVDFDLPAGAAVYNITAFNQSPLATTANTAINALATGAVTGTCKINAFGYQAP